MSQRALLFRQEGQRFAVRPAGRSLREKYAFGDVHTAEDGFNLFPGCGRELCGTFLIFRAGIIFYAGPVVLQRKKCFLIEMVENGTSKEN